MPSLNGAAKFLVVFWLLLAVNIAKTYAYIDPGTGSYLLQIIAAVLFASGLTIKIFWGKIKAFFSKSKPEGEHKNEHEDEPRSS